MKEKPLPAGKNIINADTRINLLELGIEFGLLIACPLLLFLSIGFYLDTMFATVPLFILVGLFLAIGISFYALYKKIHPILLRLNSKK